MGVITKPLPRPFQMVRRIVNVLALTGGGETTFISCLIRVRGHIYFLAGNNVKFDGPDSDSKRSPHGDE